MTTIDAPIRQYQGTTLPAPGVWEIDSGHTEVAFIGRHFMLTKVRGRFTGITGAITVADDPAASTIEVGIDMASVESGNATRDEHLRSAELFDVAAYPTAAFRSAGIVWQGAGGTVDGELTIHGVTRRVSLEVEFEGYARDPWGGHRAVASARTRIDREDFGITWNMALETGGLLVSKEIQIEINLEAVLKGA
ncbi:YceI family protein [Paractinoplanes rishiriensis]|uniref:Polyisoprenoid-binding protein n=1 Tax=Paractinoplanes rishiriensis TaxID=1050105 RepID=A0A919K4J5_9ACTN|nr:YceI family protein [Actinoplanes rishiriensis]GIF00049.1 polyisoprenoid-binding protein [Actinoplanes rishiriensis]